MSLFALLAFWILARMVTSQSRRRGLTNQRFCLLDVTGCGYIVIECVNIVWQAANHKIGLYKYGFTWK